MKPFSLLLLFLFSLLLSAQDIPKPCATFYDNPDFEQAENNYVLYRDFLRVGDWEDAFKIWKAVYEVAPAADGRRNSVFIDGIAFYEYFISQTKDTVLQQSYVDTIFTLYDEIDRCYPGGGYVPARKGFDIFYKYPNRTSKKEVYKLFKEAIDTDNLKTPDFVLNPFSALLVKLYDTGEIEKEEAYYYQDMVRSILAKGLSECKGKYCDYWISIKEYALARLEYFETVKGFYSCEYYMEKYYPEFEVNTDDCEVIKMVFSRLKFAECAEDDERFRELIRIGNENCAPKSSSPIIPGCGGSQLKYHEAIEQFQQKIEQTTDSLEKARYTLLIAKIYQVHLRNLSKARTWALKAAEIRSNWGEPYILIGRLYASSGPLCGPGRGWDSQQVIYPALDMWEKAKEIDPSIQEETDKWIDRCSQLLPTTEELSKLNLSSGQEYFVECWIKRSTKIRALD